MDIWLAVHADVRRDRDVLQVSDALARVFEREADALS
jgi:hypothetical protein